MSNVKEEWKELKPLIGKFINTLDNLYNGSESMEDFINNAELRGYKKGYLDGNVKACEDCTKALWYKSCNGYYDVIDKFMELSPESKLLVSKMIIALSDK